MISGCRHRGAVEKTAAAEGGTEPGQKESRSGAGMSQASRLSLLHGYHKVLHGYRRGQRAKMPKKISGFHLCFENTNIWGGVCKMVSQSKIVLSGTFPFSRLFAFEISFLLIIFSKACTCLLREKGVFLWH